MEERSLIFSFVEVRHVKGVTGNGNRGSVYRVFLTLLSFLFRLLLPVNYSDLFFLSSEDFIWVPCRPRSSATSSKLPLLTTCFCLATVTSVSLGIIASSAFQINIKNVTLFIFILYKLTNVTSPPYTSIFCSIIPFTNFYNQIRSK